MPEKWSRARCKRELEDKKNWETDFENGYIRQERFEFYSVTFIRFRIATYHPAWEDHHDDEIVWDLDCRMYIQRWTDGIKPGIVLIAKDDAVEMMIAALMKEGYKV